jgi:hypothetical protein
MKKIVNAAFNQKSPSPFRNCTSPQILDLPAPVLSNKFQTPRSLHRKTHSQAFSSSSNSKLSPSKSRFDVSLETSGLDVRACEDEFNRFQKLQKQRELRERASSKEEWYKITAQKKKEAEEDLIRYETWSVRQRSEAKRDELDKTRQERELEKMEKEKDFEEFNLAQKSLKEKEKEREKNELFEEISRLKTRQKEKEEKREKERREREEKRKWRIEEIQNMKMLRDQEKNRMQKEREFEREQYAIGLRNLMAKQCN